jgi:hypothetical protein
MPKRLLALNALLVLVGLALALQIGRELTRARLLPDVPEPRAVSQPQPAAPPAKGRPDQPAAYAVIATKNLFSPSRSESAAPSPALPGQRFYLHGVVLDDARSRAYIEDPMSRRVHGYAVGDTVAGGRLDKIVADRVVIARPEGPLEILLRDPAKPRPAAPAPSPAQAAPPTGPGLPQPPGIATPRPTITPTPVPVPAEEPRLEPAPPAPAPPAAPQPGVPPQFLRRGLQPRPEAER